MLFFYDFIMFWYVLLKVMLDKEIFMNDVRIFVYKSMKIDGMKIVRVVYDDYKFFYFIFCFFYYILLASLLLFDCFVGFLFIIIGLFLYLYLLIYFYLFILFLSTLLFFIFYLSLSNLVYNFSFSNWDFLI